MIEVAANANTNFAGTGRAATPGFGLPSSFDRPTHAIPADKHTGEIMSASQETQTQRVPRKQRTKAQIAASQKKAQATRLANKLAAGGAPGAIPSIQPTADRAAAMAQRAGTPPPVLISFVQSLPPTGTIVAAEQRKGYVAAFTALCDSFYPVGPIARAA